MLFGHVSGFALKLARTAAMTVVQAKSPARKSRPLPKKMVEKNLSSYYPIWLRMTPINHRKASPAKGTKATARETQPACSDSQPVS